MDNINHHYKVIQTMLRSGLLTKQAALSIKGQVKKMNYKQREEYLQKVIRGRGNASRQTKKENRL